VLPPCCADMEVSRPLQDGRFPTQAEKLRLYRSIATMDKSAPLPPLRTQTPTWGKAAALARRWELNRLGDPRSAGATTPGVWARNPRCSRTFVNSGQAQVFGIPARHPRAPATEVCRPAAIQL
jgi:hypothetical protein